MRYDPAISVTLRSSSDETRGPDRFPGPAPSTDLFEHLLTARGARDSVEIFLRQLLEPTLDRQLTDLSVANDYERVDTPLSALCLHYVNRTGDGATVDLDYHIAGTESGVGGTSVGMNFGDENAMITGRDLKVLGELVRNRLQNDPESPPVTEIETTEQAIEAGVTSTEVDIPATAGIEN